MEIIKYIVLIDLDSKECLFQTNKYKTIYILHPLSQPNSSQTCSSEQTVDHVYTTETGMLRMHGNG
jgi:hypothetical protein